MSQTSLAAINF